jgi:hypothetical protein
MGGVHVREAAVTRFGRFAFGSIQIDDTTYDHDVVIDRGRIAKRKKGPSKPLRARYGHTPLSEAERIPWHCRRLVIGTGAEAMLPITDRLVDEAARRGVELFVAPTATAIEELARAPGDTNAILHVTC